MAGNVHATPHYPRVSWIYWNLSRFGATSFGVFNGCSFCRPEPQQTHLLLPQARRSTSWDGLPSRTTRVEATASFRTTKCGRSSPRKRCCSFSGRGSERTSRYCHKSEVAHFSGRGACRRCKKVIGQLRPVRLFRRRAVAKELLLCHHGRFLLRCSGSTLKGLKAICDYRGLCDQPVGACRPSFILSVALGSSIQLPASTTSRVLQ